MPYTEIFEKEAAEMAEKQKEFDRVHRADKAKDKDAKDKDAKDKAKDGDAKDAEAEDGGKANEA